MKIDIHIFSACTQYGHKHIHFSRVTYEGLAQVHSPCKCCMISPFTSRVCTCTLHVYKPTVRRVASSSLFFDLQVVTLLLAEYTLFVREICYPTTRLRSYFSTIFAAHLRVYTRTTGCKRGFSNIGGVEHWQRSALPKYSC